MNNALPRIPDPRVGPLDDARYLVDRIAEITSRPVPEVVRRLLDEHREPGSNVRRALATGRIVPHVWSERLLEFYESTDAFLYESLVWNRNPAKNQMRRWIARFLADDLTAPGRVLTYGDGLGFDSLHLSLAGHRVDYYEVSRDCVRFAERIFRDYGGNVRTLDDETGIPDASYDGVVCLDVLEHVPAPVETVVSLARVLRPGGRFFVNAPFWMIGPSFGTHLESNRTYSGDLRRLYRPAGLRPIETAAAWNPLVLEKVVRGNEPTRVPLSTRWRIRLVGRVLSLGRITSTPFLKAGETMMRRTWQEWDELRELDTGSAT